MPGDGAIGAMEVAKAAFDDTRQVGSRPRGPGERKAHDHEGFSFY